MCSKRVRHFNLIEITLAIAILAFGMASVLYLFPLSVNSSKESIAENSIGDVAGYVMGYVKTGLANTLASNPDNGVLNYSYFTSLPTEKNTDESTEVSESQSDLKSLYDGKNPLKVVNLSKGLFTFQKVSKSANGEYAVDFACEIRMWKSPVPVTYRDGSSVKTFSLGKNASDPVFERLIYMELSWPLEAKYDDREKRCYVFDAVDGNWRFTEESKNTTGGYAGVL